MAAITIITICYNNLTALQKTCAAVDVQTCKPVAHWIINGSTTPDIQDWLLQTTQPAYRKWINEPDKGIADAFNKGISRVHNGFIHLLNSGDVYAHENVLMEVNRFLDAHPEIQWMSGKITLKRAQQWVTVGKPFDASQLYKGMRSISHPTWLVKKEVYERYGLYDINYKIGMDYDMLCRIKSEPYAFYDGVITLFDDTGISSTQYLASLNENTVIYEKHFGYSVCCRLWQFRLKVLYLLLQTPFGRWLFQLKKHLGMENK
ncbi:glycosyltransferase [Hydrotalea lipotrueae]|uniref:glycosyltransferase n=1 Tax=Hydrotalea lipotrueae TaxID=2803817 RepID=UPI001C46D76E|nr:glycosyltransferase [Hydrotalea lipotrueae]